MADANDKGQEQVKQPVAEDATERTAEQTAEAEAVALKIAEDAAAEHVPQPAPAPQQRTILLVTDGCVVSIPPAHFTMQLLEARQALQMTLIRVENEINARANAAGKAPAQVVVD